MDRSKNRKEVNARYYQRTKHIHNDKRKARALAFQKWAQSLKNGPCADCKGKFPLVCMQWHHRDPSTKIGNVSDLIRIGSRQRVLDEIAKCDLVCANCHAIRTW